MRAHALLLALKAFLDETLAAVPLPDPETGRDELGKAMCFFGNLPETDAEDLPERFPFAVMRWLEGESREDGKNEETVALILGVYAPSGSGEAELVTVMLMDHLRLALMENRTLDRRFELRLPLESAKPDPEKRQHTYHYATIMTRWEHTTPRRPLNFEGENNE